MDVTVEAYLSKLRCLCFSPSPSQFPGKVDFTHILYTGVSSIQRRVEGWGSIGSTESMSSMMNDECQVMCSIDIRLLFSCACKSICIVASMSAYSEAMQVKRRLEAEMEEEETESWREI